MTSLRELIDNVLETKKWTQEQLGREIGASQSMISKMRLGPDWEKHWQVALKLLEIAKQAGVSIKKRV